VRRTWAGRECIGGLNDDAVCVERFLENTNKHQTVTFKSLLSLATLLPIAITK
jgi:hypothetical protein